MLSIVRDVSVDTESSGALVVRWSIEGPPIPVDVAVGASPEGVDHAHATTAPAGVTRLTIGDPAPGRRFVSVSPHGGGSAVVGADRRVGFEGAANFRDLGGYPTRTGGRTRWGLVFRADSLHALTERDLGLYERLGLRVVIDLRSAQEREMFPSPVDSWTVPLVFRREQADDERPFLDASTVEDGERFLAELYVGHLELAAERIGEIFTRLASPDNVPAVFHCHAGKDRTGLVAALLLEALGVGRETVLDDYQLTARYRPREHQDGTFQRLVDRGLPPEAAAGVLTTPRWAMGDALTALDEVHGGLEAYLLGPAGMDPADLAGLRTRLVAPC